MSRAILKRTEVYPEDSAFAYRECADDDEEDPVSVQLLGPSDSERPVPLAERKVLSIEWRSPSGDDLAVLFDAEELARFMDES